MAALALLTFLAVPMGMWGQSDYSTNYTGNITLSTTGGTNASACKVKINNTDYDGIKAGTSSKTGAVQISVPANTKYLHLHVAGWSSESVTLSVTPSGYSGNINLTSNSGISGNSPFTFSGDASTNNYYKVITFTNALTSNTTLTFTASSGIRFVVWGVSSEEDGDPTYTVTYDCNGGTSGCPTENPTGLSLNDHITLAAAPSKPGHSFSGWNDGTTTYAAGADYTVTGSVTMTAQWTINTHDVTVQGNTHGTVTGYTNPVAYGTEVTLVYTHNNGEYYSATFASNNVAITDGTFTMPDNAVTITVTETALPVYTVTLSDGGTLTEAHYGAGVTLPNRTGDGTYTFAGWTTSNIATETTDAPTIIPTTVTYYPTANITLYPVYTRSEGGATVWQKITASFSTIGEGTYALITPDGHAFNGELDNGDGQVTSDAFSFDSNNESTTAPSGTFELTLTAVTENDVVVGYTMYNSTKKYLYAKAASKNHLAWHDTEDSYWKNYYNNWLYNSNSAYLRTYNNTIFRTYSGASNSAFNFVKKISNSTTYYISTLSSIAVPSFDPESQNFSTASLTVTITANEGCFISYTTDGTAPESSSTATLTNSNSATVTVYETTTIRAMAFDGNDFSAEASQTYTRVYAVTLMSNGVEKSTEEVVPTESISLSTPDNVPEGFTFMGWTADPSTPNTLVNTEYTPTGNVTLYASFAKIISSSYDKVTSASDMTEGEYIIATYYGSKYYTIKSNTAVSSNPAAYEQAVTDNAITGDVTELTWSFTGTSSAMVIKSTSQNLYLNTTNTAQGVKINTTDNDSWTISYNSTDNYFSMKSKNGGGSRYLSVLISNDSPQDWRNYSSGTQNSYQQITLFKKNAIVAENYYTQVQELPAGNSVIATVTPADLITVPSGAVLTITGACTGGPENLIIEDGGKLITYSTGVQATVQKSISKATHWGAQPENPEEHYSPDGWYFIASPVNGAAFPTGSVNDQDIYQLDWANNNWLNLQNSSHSSLLTTGFQRGTGYLYASKDGNTINFAGEIQPLSNDNNATVTLANDGWNLIGNPLTCKVTVNCAFDELNNASGVTSQLSGSTINPCQGIAVWGSAYDDVTFTKAATQNATAPGNSALQMTVAQNIVTRGNTTSTTVDNAVVSFNESSILPKFNMLEGNAKLYIPQGNEEYAIVSTEAQGEMPVNFRANENGQYTLTVNPENVEMGYLHLIDNMTGADIDLLANPSYSFNAKADDYESRFRLVFAANNEDGVSTGSTTFAFFSNGSWIINNEGEATLQVIDLNGRILSSETINGSVSTNINATTGIYMMRLINGDNVKTQKVVVR